LDSNVNNWESSAELSKIKSGNGNEGFPLIGDIESKQGIS
jgi:hypothetical protein